MSYYFFIDTMMLPIPPPKMSIKINNKNKTINLINEGEVNIIKEPGLTEISFEARFPNVKYPFASYDSSLEDMAVSFVTGDSFTLKKAVYFLDKLEQNKVAKTPLRLIVSRMTSYFTMLFDTNMLVTLEDYQINEDAKEGTDVIVPLKFKQYRPYGTKECEVTVDENGQQHINVKENRPAPDKTIPNVCEIRDEQTIFEACKRAANGSLDWLQVAANNGITNPMTKSIAGMALKL